MSAEPAPTLGEALAQYRREHGLPADDAARASWTCRIGPVLLRLPNFGWRRNAIEAHDLHHVLTGYPCTMAGECRMAAWEFGAGRMPHWAASGFCLPLVLAGMFREPRTIFSAFAAGRRSRTLHGAAVRETLLVAPLAGARAGLTRPRAAAKPWSDRLRFAELLLRASLLLLAPICAALGIWHALRSL
jgi:hypothetical protein